jgi:very-short-patch-repair endonuclease
MQEITKRLHDSALENFIPVIERMAEEGHSENEIVDAYQSHMRLKTAHYYSKLKEPKPIGDCLNIDDLQNADSKIEKIFYDSLVKSGIRFDFQMKIGPYRVDYLIMGFLVVEIDGPQHEKNHDDRRDAYLRKMGYKIIRIPVWVLVSCPDAIMQEIKELMRIRRGK